MKETLFTIIVFLMAFVALDFLGIVAAIATLLTGVYIQRYCNVFIR